MREPTVRTQKIHRNYLKLRLIIFGGLALALVIASYFSESLCPYDPYLQDLGNAKAIPSAAHLFGTDRYGRDMLSRVIVGSKTSIYSTLLLVGFIMVFGTMIGIFCAWSGKKIDSVLMRVCFGCGSSAWRWSSQCDYCTCGHQLAKVCACCKESNAGTKRNSLYKSCQVIGMWDWKNNFKAYSSEHLWSDSGYGSIRYWYDDDGTGRSFLFGAWSKAADCRMGKHDERYKKSFNDSSMGNTGSRFCNLCIGCDF